MTCKDLIELLKDVPPETRVGMWPEGSGFDEWSNVTGITRRLHGYVLLLNNDDGMCDEEDDAETCTNVKCETSANLSGCKIIAVNDEIWGLKEKCLDVDDPKVGQILYKLCSLMQENMIGLTKENDYAEN